MRAVLVGVTAAVLFAGLSGSANGRQPEKIDAKLLVGKWTPKEKVGKEFTVEFSKDGKVVVAADGGHVKVADGTYKLDGNLLTMNLKFGDGEATKKRTIHSLSKTELVSTEEGGGKDTLVRVPAK